MISMDNRIDQDQLREGLPAFRPGDTGRPIRRYWRGPTWLFATRFAVDGLLRAGREDAAREMLSDLATTTSSPARRSSSPTASTTWRTTSSTWCSRARRMHRKA